MEIEKFLLDVQKPGRYIGREFNSINKEITPDTFNFVLCFPDVYEIGMSHLGMKVLYHILNKQKDVFCERCFAPWTDMEKVLREQAIPLMSLESQRSLQEFDVIGFSLQYELSFTNVLNMLDLANIPLYSKDRVRAPLIIAGGPCAYNPEPMAEFIDVFVVGEAEELILELVAACREFKDTVTHIPESDLEVYAQAKEKLLLKLANIEGVYVPRFYNPEVENGMIVSVTARDQDIPCSIKRRYVEDLDAAEFPVSPPVPYVEIVHDRISLEIMRGCPNQCFFCQAGFVTKPVRIRSAEKVIQLAEESYRNTGYEKISFCALSSANYPHLQEVISRLHSSCQEKGVGISLPSLRVNKDFSGILALMGGLKKSGLTFAPEAGSERLRRLINKQIDIQRLKEAVLEAYRLGWKKLKLYFMIGLPTETEEDLESIVALVKEFTLLRKEVDGRRGQINVSISNFIPKPHTPFQWMGMEKTDVLLNKQEFLRSKLRAKNIDISFHDVKMSFLEAYLCRGDRSLHVVLEKAFRLGARFDGWSNMFNSNIWKEALGQHALGAQEYVCKPREQTESLPWGHIDCGANNQLLPPGLTG
ncbi:MAG: TIGR03960 family B12-binding radical SAM protein [PVC group bacterium]|nr:TIGR03960 family B12-binding radical SAM protein [PVC group bacterium]